MMFSLTVRKGPKDPQLVIEVWGSPEHVGELQDVIYRYLCEYQREKDPPKVSPEQAQALTR